MLKVTPELLRFLGYYISEGSINTARKNNTMALYNKDPAVLGDMKKCAELVCGSKARERAVDGWGTCTELRLSNKVIFEFLKAACGHTSAKKRVPGFVFGLSKERIGQFLSGLYAGDSHIRESSITYYTISRQLANDVAYLLAALGIVGRIKRKPYGAKSGDIYTVTFHKKSEMETFAKYVDPVGKKVKLRAFGRPEKARLLGQRGLSSQAGDKIGGAYIDTIESVERVDLAKPVDVYDFSVPGTQNFVGGFGGVFLHNTGHSALATIHAASISQLIDRLITPPISLPPSLLENVNIIVFLTHAKLKGSYVRRADTIVEIVGIKANMPVGKKVFEWDPGKDVFEPRERSVILSAISKRVGMTEDELRNDIMRRKQILEWMLKERVFDYREVARVVNMYYTDPERLMKLIAEWQG